MGSVLHLSAGFFLKKSLVDHGLCAGESALFYFSELHMYLMQRTNLQLQLRQPENAVLGHQQIRMLQTNKQRPTNHVVYQTCV